MNGTEKIIGDFQVLHKIGQGGFGEVYKGINKRNNKTVAIKLHKQFRTSNQSQGKALKFLQGGIGIPKVFYMGNQDGKSFIVMELLGSSLHELHKSEPSLFTPEFTASVSLKALQILEFIHSKGYIHRDIKPQQFLFSQGYKRLKLVDFGLAREYMYVKQHIIFSQQGVHAGSASYASINSHLGYRQSRRDDLESFMYMMIFLVRGKLPWQNSGLGSQHSR